jgi:Protein of unknown function (DUF3887)
MADSARTKCEHCGRPLAPAAERGRKRRYCNATCRSAARRRRDRQHADATSVVKESLTTPTHKTDIDTVVPALTGPLREASDLAGRLTARLSSMPAEGAGSSLPAVAAVVDLGRLVDQVLRAAVDRARADGHTWQEIGEVLGTTRQAAFQRFGRPIDPRTGAVMAEKILPDAADRAVELLSDVIDGRYARACRDFDDTVAQRLDANRLAAVRAQLAGMVGGYESMDAAHAYQAGDYTIVDVALHFEAGDLTGRVSYDRAGKVAGLHFLPDGRGGPRPTAGQ